MRVLFTNNTLAERAGSELYVRDVAIALARRGHQPVCYSTLLGAVAEDLRAATIPVIDNLAQLAVPPDIIHGQHHLDTMTAALRLPGVPVVYFCHGWDPWEETPPRFPTIQLYVVTSDLIHERLQCMYGIASEKIRVIRNFVDLARFQLRSSFAPRPRRALAFGNYLPEAGCLETLRQACAARGIELDAMGTSSGRIEAHPEEALGQYDIVFGMGRCALEALASGAALIVCGYAGLGDMVVPDNYGEMRRFNFGLRCLRQPLTVEAVTTAIDRYDAGQAKCVSLRARSEIDLDDAVTQILAVYQEAVAGYREERAAPQILLQHTSDYIRGIAEFVKNRGAVDRRRWQTEVESSAQCQRAELALQAADAQRLRAEQALSAAQVQLQAEALRASETQAALSQLEAQLAAAREALSERELELAAIHGSRLWPIITRIQHMRHLVLSFGARLAVKRSS